MLRRNKAIACFIAGAIVFSSVGNLTYVFADENNEAVMDEIIQDVEKEEIKEDQKDEGIIEGEISEAVKDGAGNENTDEIEVTEVEENQESEDLKEKEAVEEMKQDSVSDSEEIKENNEAAVEEKTEAIVGNVNEEVVEEKTEEIKAEEASEENLGIELYGIEAVGNLIDFNNVYDGNQKYIVLNVDDKYKDNLSAEVELVNINDPSKKLKYYANGSNIAYLEPRSISDNGIYEVAKVSLNEFGWGTFADIAYINPKYKDVTNPSASVVKDMEFPEFQLEVINYNVLNLSFEEFSVDNEFFSNGTEVGFTVKVKSNKIIQGMGGTIIGDTGNQSDMFNVMGEVVKVEGDYYTLHFKASGYAEGFRPIEYMASANYRIEDLYVGYEYQQGEFNETMYAGYVDTRSANKGNEIEYDFSPLDFQCNNPDEDIIAPTIEGIVLDKTVVVEGDKIKVSIKVNDDKSGFDKWYDMYLIWRNSDDEDQVIMNIASYNEETGYFECEVDIYGEMYNEDWTERLPLKPGVYSIEAIGLSDYACNRAIYNRENAAELLAKADIKVVDKDTEEDNNNGENNGNNGGNNGGETDNNGGGQEKPSEDVKPDKKPDTDKKEDDEKGKDKLPQTGGAASSGAAALLGSLLLLGGGTLSLKKGNRKNK